MSSPKETVQQHIISTLVERRGHLRTERMHLRKASDRLAEIKAEIDEINTQLKGLGHEDKPTPQPVTDTD